jgi:hypothetical protein
VVVAVLAAVVAGVVIGAVARVLMRMVILAAGAEAGFSWGGSLGICLTFAAAMMPGALVASLVSGRARWVLPVAGALFLCVPAVGIAAEEVGNTAGFSTASWLGVGAAGLGVFATIAMLPIVTVRLVDRLGP